MSRKKKKSKNSAPDVPSFAPSEIRYGDQVVGRTYMDPSGQIVSQYFASPEEEQRKRVANERINQILPTLGMTGAERAQQFDRTRQDYVDQQSDAFNRDYDKALRNLREDVGARFGTLKSSQYFDRLAELEKEVRAPAIQEINRNASLLRTSLDDQEQASKLRELSALGYTLNQDQSTFLNNLQAPLSGSQLANQFNQNNYTNRLNAFNQELVNKQNATNSFLNFIGRAF